MSSIFPSCLYDLPGWRNDNEIEICIDRINRTVSSWWIDPCYGYEKYFKSISVPFLRGDKQLNREKLMLTSDGYAYFMKKMGGFKL